MKKTPVVENTVSIELVLTTKHVAPKFNMKPQAFRRVLRAMPEYADGKHTNYRWAEKDDMFSRIAEFIKTRTAAAEKSKAEALAKLKKAEAPAATPAKA